MPAILAMEVRGVILSRNLEGPHIGEDEKKSEPSQQTLFVIQRDLATCSGSAFSMLVQQEREIILVRRLFPASLRLCVQCWISTQSFCYISDRQKLLV